MIIDKITGVGLFGVSAALLWVIYLLLTDFSANNTFETYFAALSVCGLMLAAIFVCAGGIVAIHSEDA